MMELGKPYSWWFDSHTSPRRSVWLQSTISELDEKTKAMLKLVEEDADSFAQRAEMYYKRRPELVTMVGDFYRMHRSLAERFDQLKSESRISLIKPFCSPFQAKKLMNQMEKPKRAEMYYKRRPELVTMVGHRPLVERFDQLKSESRISLIKPFCSPFQAKKLLNQMEKPNDNYSQHYDSGDSESEVDDPEQEEDSHVDGAMEDEHCTESEVDDPELEDKANVDREMGDGEWYEESEVDDPECEEETQVVGGEISNIGKSNVLKLKAEIEKLKEENRIQKEQLLGELSGLIHESEVAKLRDETERLIEENRIQKEQILGEFSGLIHESEVAKLRDEIERLKKDPKEKLPGESSSLIRESEAAKLRDEIKKLKKENRIQKGQLQGEFSSCESEVAKLRDEIESLKEENRIQKEQLLGHFSSLIGEKVDEMARVKEENIVQKEQLIQKDEEKREVIRQLSLSLDILRENLMSAGNKSIVIHSSKKLKGGLFSAKLFGGFFKVSE